MATPRVAVLCVLLCAGASFPAGADEVARNDLTELEANAELSVGTCMVQLAMTRLDKSAAEVDAFIKGSEGKAGPAPPVDIEAAHSKCSQERISALDQAWQKARWDLRKNAASLVQLDGWYMSWLQLLDGMPITTQTSTDELKKAMARIIAQAT